MVHAHCAAFSPPKLQGPTLNPIRVKGKQLFKFDVGDLVTVKYDHPTPTGATQKKLVGEKLIGRVLAFTASKVRFYCMKIIFMTIYFVS